MRLQEGHQIANIAIVPKEEEKDEPLTFAEATPPKEPLIIEETPLETETQKTQEIETKKKPESLFDLLDEE
jgi:hypothetical protein